jgi:hypothetical protein
MTLPNVARTGGAGGRWKVMPWLAGAGLMVSSHASPECSPTPQKVTSLETVACAAACGSKRPLLRCTALET